MQRSITFPPIKLKKIDDYMLYVAKNKARVVELKEKMLDFGRGRGDITRFLERIGVIEVGEFVEFTNLGREVVSLRESLGTAVYHALLYQRVPQYKLLIDVLKERDLARDVLYELVNKRLAELSPTAWVNRVAFRALLQIGEDLRTVKRNNGVYSYLEDCVEIAVTNFYTRHGARVGDNFYTSFDKLLIPECGKLEHPLNLYRVDIRCIVSKIYSKFS